MSKDSYKPKNAYALKQSTDDFFGTLKIFKCDDKFPLKNLSKDELDAFINLAKKVEGMTWKITKTYSDLKYEVFTRLHSNMPEDELCIQ